METETVANVATSGNESLAPEQTGAVQESAPAQEADSQSEMLETLRQIRERDKEPESDQAVKPEPEKAPEPAPVPAREMPASWKSRHEEHWGKLTPEQQEVVLTREREMAAGVEKLQSKYKPLESVKAAIEPYAQEWEKMGFTPDQAVLRLANAEKQLRENPAATIVQLAKMAGVDLAQLAQSANAPRAPIDPIVQQLQQKVSSLEQQLTARQQAEIENETAQISQEFEKFRQGREFVDDVRPIMADLLQKGLADSFEDAYEKAVLLNPATKDRILEKQAQEKLAAQQEQAAKARAASRLNVNPSRGGINTSMSLDDTLIETMAAIRARG